MLSFYFLDELFHIFFFLNVFSKWVTIFFLLNVVCLTTDAMQLLWYYCYEASQSCIRIHAIEELMNLNPFKPCSDERQDGNIT